MNNVWPTYVNNGPENFSLRTNIEEREKAQKPDDANVEWTPRAGSLVWL